MHRCLYRVKCESDFLPFFSIKPSSMDGSLDVMHCNAYYEQIRSELGLPLCNLQAFENLNKSITKDAVIYEKVVSKCPNEIVQAISTSVTHYTS